MSAMLNVDGVTYEPLLLRCVKCHCGCRIRLAGYNISTELVHASLLILLHTRPRERFQNQDADTNNNNTTTTKGTVTYHVWVVKESVLHARQQWKHHFAFDAHSLAGKLDKRPHGAVREHFPRCAERIEVVRVHLYRTTPRENFIRLPWNISRREGRLINTVINCEPLVDGRVRLVTQKID